MVAKCLAVRDPIRTCAEGYGQRLGLFALKADSLLSVSLCHCNSLVSCNGTIHVQNCCSSSVLIVLKKS
jgi:hypothetical protein